MKPRISFVIPSFQQAGFLAQALDSIALQGLERGEFEVIVMDGGSADGSKEILQNHAVVTYWESVQDSGQGHALNKALAMARGEIIGWLNADDFYFSDAVRTVLAVFESQSEVDLVYGECMDVDAAGRSVRKSPVRPWTPSAILDSCIIAQPACFFRASFAKKNGPFREDLHLSLDYEYWLRSREWAGVFCVSEILAANRIHAEAKSSHSRVRQLFESARLVRAYSGQWNRAWLRRIASAQARAVFRPWRLSETRCRRWLSGLLYGWLCFWMEIRWRCCPLRVEDSSQGASHVTD